MMFKRAAGVLALALAVTGCSTATYFKLPENSKVAVYERPQQYSQGLVKTRAHSSGQPLAVSRTR
ncbi:hypothetical protein SAMN05216194_108122 [Stutzerimonas kunmingensis]|uniref:hypothetical protein n=1 Tax=Stutzerimonas kunmingensis TaxID=1211807 RepID=UPI0008E6EFCB|nr:hypothetical protein [Stutzerimonas kunmingensis]MCQ2044306.1 hypothetical protein [Stutzerimonas kunmingensis]SFJ92749.1 hypothetical protein SAMN05216194_108122 [Stutzerimonas kunmingensis]